MLGVKNKSCPLKKSYIRLPDTILCNFAEFVSLLCCEMMVYKTKFNFCPPNQGASRATKADVFYACEIIYLIFIWTFNYGNLVKSPCTSKQLYMNVNSKSCGAQTGSSCFSFVDFLLISACYGAVSIFN